MAQLGWAAGIGVWGGGEAALHTRDGGRLWAGEDPAGHRTVRVSPQPSAHANLTPTLWLKMRQRKKCVARTLTN